jgi:tRNA(Ile2) C34 agmatinyltransferase TiaS
MEKRSSVTPASAIFPSVSLPSTPKLLRTNPAIRYPTRGGRPILLEAAPKTNAATIHNGFIIG